MADERFIAAIARIERAVARIENSAIAASVAEYKDLAQRHERLKSETLSAIQDLDKILADAA